MQSDHTRLALCCALIIYAAPAYAYLDPGTGSLLIQGIIAAIAAAGAAARFYWHRIVGLFRGNKPHDEMQQVERTDDRSD